MRTGRGLGMVLHGERGDVDALQAFDHVVVQIDVGDEHPAVPAVTVRGRNRLADRGVDGEAEVVRGDLDLAGGRVLDRLVDAAVAELELVRAEPQRAAQQLIAKADAEERVSGVQHLAQQRHLRLGLLRVAGAVREEHAVRVQGLQLFEGDGGRHHMHAAAAFGHAVRRHGLDAQVDGGDGEQRLLALVLAARLDGVGLLGADLVVQAQPLHLRGGLDLVEKIVDGAQTDVSVLQDLT